MRYFLAAVALALASAGSARAQFGSVTIGGDARAFAMGGAGVATLGGPNRSNPASLAFDKGLIKFYPPSIGLRTGGALDRAGRALDYLASQSSGGDTNTIEKLARDYARSDSNLGLNGSIGLRFGHIEVQASSVALARLQPSDSLRQWASSGGPLPDDLRADVLAAGIYSLPQIGAAVTLPDKNTERRYNVAVGGRLKYLNAVYTHQVLTSQNEEFKAENAVEMQGKDTLTKKGVGADIGVMFESRDQTIGRLSAGVVINNFLKPGLTIDGTDRFGNPVRYDLLARTISAGAGFQKGGLTAAADLVDITGAVGSAQLRAGAEQRFGPIAVRGGYSSGTGFTYGFGIFGVDVAFGRRQPLELVKNIRF
jgi:hypothetical protein